MAPIERGNRYEIEERQHQVRGLDIQRHDLQQPEHSCRRWDSLRQQAQEHKHESEHDEKHQVHRDPGKADDYVATDEVSVVSGIDWDWLGAAENVRAVRLP